MKVSFKESVRKTAINKFRIEKEFNGNQIYFEIELELYPIEVEYTNLESQNENFDVSSLFEKETNNKIDEIVKIILKYIFMQKNASIHIFQIIFFILEPN